MTFIWNFYEPREWLLKDNQGYAVQMFKGDSNTTTTREKRNNKL